MSRELETFAERVRRQCTAIMGAAMNGNSQRCLELAGALCTEAATVANQSQMQQEAAGIETLSLADLPAPSFTSEPE